MANADAAFGLRPAKAFGSFGWTGGITTCQVLSAHANMFVGDPIVIAGAAVEQTDGGPRGHYLNVGIATGGDAQFLDGCIVGIEPDRSDLSVNYSKTGSNRLVKVALNYPGALYEIQDDGDGTVVAGYIGANAVLAAGAGGSTTTGYSSWEIDASDTPAADASNQVIIMGHRNAEDNEMGDFAVWLVMFIHSHLAPGTLGVGV